MSVKTKIVHGETILITNITERRYGVFVNQYKHNVHCMISDLSFLATADIPSAIRYASHLHIHVTLQSDDRNRILVPWIEVNYTDISTTGERQVVKEPVC